MPSASLMQQVLDELKSIRSDVTEVKVTVGQQVVTLSQFKTDIGGVRVDLNDHMKRTELLERFTAKWAGAWTLLGGLGLLVSITAGVAKVLGKL